MQQKTATTCGICGDTSGRRHVCSVASAAKKSVSVAKPRTFDPKVQPDWTHFKLVRCTGEMIEDEHGNAVIVSTPERWAQGYSCIKHQGKMVSTVGFEQVISGTWRKEVSPENHRDISWSLPAGHAAYSADTIPDEKDMMDIMRALDAKNRAAREGRGMDLSPLIPKDDPVTVGV